MKRIIGSIISGMVFSGIFVGLITMAGVPLSFTIVSAIASYFYYSEWDYLWDN